jgi:hypothetical protein
MKKNIFEQPQPNTGTDLDKLKRAIDAGCIAKYKWFVPLTGGKDQKYPSLRKETASGKDVIAGKGTKDGTVFLFYADGTLKNLKSGKSHPWVCDAMNVVPETPLTVNQSKVLEIIGRTENGGWFVKPVPTDVEVEDGTFTKEDLSAPSSGETILLRYKKYFPNEFFVYRKGGKKPQVDPTTPVKPTVTPTPGGSTTPSTISQGLKDQLEKVKVDFNEVACEGLINSYFEMAQYGGQQDPKALDEIKNAVYGCYRKNMRNMSANTKDQLRWLSGNEENAKNILGMKKFKKIGNIRQDNERRVYRLDKLPSF